ncbi:MAG: hypothetical protein ACTS3T_18865 [Almyronema sp.]
MVQPSFWNVCQRFTFRPLWLLATLGFSGGLAHAQTPPQPPFPPSAGGSRGDVCIVSPLIVPQSELTVWSDRPLFVWQGPVTQIAISPIETGEPIWQAEPTAETTELPYGAETPLQPGQTYLWQVYGGPFAAELYRIPFRVMTAERQAVIADELTVLKTQLAIEQASPEDQALRQITYFSDRYLWADALQIAAQSPTATAERYIQTAIEQSCGAANSAATASPTLFELQRSLRTRP